MIEQMIYIDIIGLFNLGKSHKMKMLGLNQFDFDTNRWRSQAMIRFSRPMDKEATAGPQGDELVALACRQMREGFAPPAEIYRTEYRDRIDWSQYPAWAKPVDPQVFEGCCHEG